MFLIISIVAIGLTLISWTPFKFSGIATVVAGISLAIYIPLITPAVSWLVGVVL
jgi:hypothetical protein